MEIHLGQGQPGPASAPETGQRAGATMCVCRVARLMLAPDDADARPGQTVLVPWRWIWARGPVRRPSRYGVDGRDGQDTRSPVTQRQW